MYENRVFDQMLSRLAPVEGDTEIVDRETHI